MRLLEKNLRVYEDTATMSEIVNGVTTDVEFKWSFIGYRPMDNEVDVDIELVDAKIYDNDNHEDAKLTPNELLEIENFTREYIEDNAIDYGLLETYADHNEYINEEY